MGMYRGVRSVEVNCLFDFKNMYERYGSFNIEEITPSRVRFYLDAHRTETLRDVMYILLPSPPFNMGEDVTKLLDKNGTDSLDDIKKYIIKALSEPYSVGDGTPYYMKLKESKDKPNLFFLDIVLNCNFFSYIKENPGERIKILLQEILEILYDNDITDSEIVGHYLGLCLQGTEVFEENFFKFLGDYNE